MPKDLNNECHSSHLRPERRNQLSINAFLLKKFFNNGLNSDMFSLFSDGFGVDKTLNAQLIPADNNSDRHPLNKSNHDIICLLLQGLSSDKMEAISHALHLSPEKKIKFGALTSRLDFVEGQKSKLTKNEFEQVITHDDILNSICAENDINLFYNFFEYCIGPQQRIADSLHSADFGRIFANACQYGYHNTLNALKRYMSREDISTFIRADYFETYRNACLNGCIDTIQFIEAYLSQTEINKLIQANYNNTYELVCLSGKVGAIKHIESHMQYAEVIELIQKNNFSAFKKTCASGSLHAIQFMERQLVSANKDLLTKALQADDFGAYRQALMSGRLDVIKHIESQLNTRDILKVLQPNQFFIVLNAFSKGHVDVIRHMETLLPQGYIPRLINENIMTFLAKAMVHGQLKILQHVETYLGPDDVRNAIKKNDYMLYQCAYESGNLSLIRFIETHYHTLDILEAIKANEFKTLQIACENGDLDLFHHAQSHLNSGILQKVMKQDDFHLFQLTCESGSLDLVQQVASHLSQKEQIEAIKAHHFWAFYHGHVDLIRYFSQYLDKEQITDTIQANDFCVFKNCMSRHNVTAIKYFLEDAACFLYAESKDRTYGVPFIYSFVKHKISALIQRQKVQKLITPKVVFDVSATEAVFFFYILRHLIRRGAYRDYALAEDMTEKLQFLINIPAIQKLCHQKVGHTGDTNELLKFAIKIDNKPAIKRLLTIPAVLSEAKSHDFYIQLPQYNLTFQYDCIKQILALSPKDFSNTLFKLRSEELLQLLKTRDDNYTPLSDLILKSTHLKTIFILYLQSKDGLQKLLGLNHLSGSSSSQTLFSPSRHQKKNKLNLLRLKLFESFTNPGGALSSEEVSLIKKNESLRFIVDLLIKAHRGIDSTTYFINMSAELKRIQLDNQQTPSP